MQIKLCINPSLPSGLRAKCKVFLRDRKRFVISTLTSLQLHLSVALTNLHSPRTPLNHTEIISNFWNILCFISKTLSDVNHKKSSTGILSFPHPLLNSYVLGSLYRCHLLWAIRIRNPFLGCLKNHILLTLCGEDARWPPDLRPLFLGHRKPAFPSLPRNWWVMWSSSAQWTKKSASGI